MMYDTRLRRIYLNYGYPPERSIRADLLGGRGRVLYKNKGKLISDETIILREAFVMWRGRIDADT